MDKQDSRPAPQAAKKKKKKGKIITVGAGLEDFVDWVDPNISDSTKEREADMSNLAAEFVAQMRKRAASSQRETTPGSEVSSEKLPKRSGLDEEAQKSPAVIVVNSPKRASNVLPALEGATQDASREACASLEDGAPAGGLPNVDRAVSEAPTTKTTISPPLQTRRPKVRLPDRLRLGSYVELM